MSMDWKTVVATISPWIGTALGGPLGGMAVTAAANALGLSDKTIDAVKQAVMGMTPDQALAMKTADQAFALHMQELGFKQVFVQPAAGDSGAALGAALAGARLTIWPSPYRTASASAAARVGALTVRPRLVSHFVMSGPPQSSGISFSTARNPCQVFSLRLLQYVSPRPILYA